ncbi:homeotic protein ultrabithorax-like isoform X2 [Neofelis nebulosa]|uniref:homeotic protein ultrabithorax-like isoform X2 n=1 Tax=Neofelis nebulosa TaxID=61452 RepID=UPI00272B1E29|nr:homeotic protein ultrabithorax-like isoform X2 [Neofelis nebulosa]
MPTAPCRLPGPRALSRRGGQDSRFPARAAAGRFQPRPIFGESLSGLRHPAPGGGGGGTGSGSGDGAAAALLLSAWASGRRASGAAGAGSSARGRPTRPRPSPSPQPGEGRGPARAAWEAGAEGAAAGLCHFSRPPHC